MRAALGRLTRPAMSSSSSSSASPSSSSSVHFPQLVAPRQTRTMLLKATTLAGNRGTLMGAQESLPSLPVPQLEQTLQKYLRTTLPHHENAASLQATRDAVQSALAGADAPLFRELQSRLERRADSAESEGNWLASWWNEAAYMAYRDPVVPYVSYFYLHRDDPRRRNGVQRAASQIKAMLRFREMLESETLTPEKAKTGPLCSASYPWMFNSTRLPLKPMDGAKKYDPRSHNHVVVARNGRFYEVELVVDGQELSAVELEGQLQRIVSDAATPEPNPVGALTSENRDAWTEAREALLNVGDGGGAHNAASLERIESAVVVLCLDAEKPVTTEERAWNGWFGDAKNRFYDKQQLIVTDNGESAFMGEHSTMDGTPTLRMNDFVLSSLAADKVDLGSSSRSGLPPPKPITFVLDRDVESRVHSALAHFQSLKARHDLAFLDFQGYGKGAIKKFKCSPDAWAQMGIQLAYYKMHGRPCPTYESAQTRRFRWGRTETIRSASVESKAFCEAMEGGEVSDEERYQKFQAAVKQHLDYASAAAAGQGVDRHLFGLKKLLRDGESLPALYRDASFGKTSNWQLSTSQISSESFDAWGFGEVTPDGFGCAYAIKEASLTFTLTSLGLGADRLRHYLNEALVELRDLHLRLAAKQSQSASAKI